MSVKKSLLILLLFTLSVSFFQAFCSDSPASQKEFIINTKNLPVLETLSSYDQLFAEYCSIVESNYKALSAGRKPEYIFFAYKNTQKFTLQALASRCNIPYETIATLNRIEYSAADIKNKTLILPAVPGLFILLNKGGSNFEVLLRENQENQNLTNGTLYYKIDGTDFVFLQNKRLSSTERYYFLDSAIQLPLEKDSFWVSSEFGKRKNPFSNAIKNHNGIDLAASEGTPVYAVADGAAAYCIQDDPEFGKYIILSHNQGKMTSVYAHLSKICVEQYQSVRKGDLIGYVGHTGMATGSHLHFEIRQGGKAEDPRLKLKF